MKRLKILVCACVICTSFLFSACGATPTINVEVPPPEPPTINVEVPTPEPPIINIEVPQQEQPIINIEIPPQEPPIINIELPTETAPEFTKVLYYQYFNDISVVHGGNSTVIVHFDGIEVVEDINDFDTMLECSIGAVYGEPLFRPTEQYDFRLDGKWRINYVNGGMPLLSWQGSII